MWTVLLMKLWTKSFWKKLWINVDNSVNSSTGLSTEKSECFRYIKPLVHNFTTPTTVTTKYIYNIYI